MSMSKVNEMTTTLNSLLNQTTFNDLILCATGILETMANSLIVINKEKVKILNKNELSK